MIGNVFTSAGNRRAPPVQRHEILAKQTGEGPEGRPVPAAEPSGRGRSADHLHCYRPGQEFRVRTLKMIILPIHTASLIRFSSKG